MSNTFLEELLAAATTTIYNRHQEEEEANAQRRRNRKECGQARLLAAYKDRAHLGRPRPTAAGQVLCLVLKKPGHWAKEYANREKPPLCPKCRKKGHWGATCPQVKGHRSQGQSL